MKKFKECTIHIGTEKTGTTSIQVFLASNREKLNDGGYFYPQSLGYESHFKVFPCCLNDQKYDQLSEMILHNIQMDGADFRSYLIEEFEKEIYNVHSSNLIVSSEHFQSRLTELSEIQRLRDFFVPYCKNIRILVYLRRQDELYCSQYSTALRSGEISLQIFPINESLDYYDYKELLEKYASVFGKENITVRIFDKKQLFENDIVKDFLNEIECKETRFFTYPVKLNESLSSVAQKFLMLLNRVSPTFIDCAPNPVNAEVIILLERLFPGNPILPSKREA